MKKRILPGILLSLLFLLILSLYASAGTYINVSIVETVYQNTTYAENFDLVESQKSCMSRGVLTVTNPNTDTVTDIFMELANTRPLNTDFVNVGGRTGLQVAGGAEHSTEYSTGNIGNNVNNMTILYDLDNDGFFTDYMWVNSTDIIFNLSSESDIISIKLYNSSGDVDISNAAAVNVPINMVEENITGSSGTVYGNITIIGTTTADDELTVATVNITLNEHWINSIVLFIAELRPSESAIFNYNISCMGMDPPLNIETEYQNPRTGHNAKVLAGFNWTIIQNASNTALVDITNINISITASQVRWNNTLFNFTLLELDSSGDYGNVSTAGGSQYRWTWAPRGGNLSTGASDSWADITYIVGAPEAVPFTATYLAIEENITYSLDALLSNLTIVNINGSSDIEFSMEKKIERPADSTESHNVTWQIIPNITIPMDITYNLNKVTVWVTQDKSPINHTDSTIWGRLERNYTALGEVNLTLGWGGAANDWKFNYTDGYSAAYPPPIVWMKPEWIITNKFGQILNYTSSVSGADWYLKYIYVVHGYWLSVEKNVTSVAEDTYAINITVENIGNGWTPQYEKVTVYDFIPNEFAPSGWTTLPNSNESVGTAGSDYFGTAYVWDIGFKPGMNSSLGPKFGPYATGPANYSWTAGYNVTGSGQYRVTELYIVGLDPLRVDGAFTSPIITIISGIQSYSNELLYISVVAFLIIVNVTNLVMTNRIHQKLNQRLPPPPKPAAYANNFHSRPPHM